MTETKTLPFPGQEEEYAPPPLGDPIIEPFKTAVEFWPCLTPEKYAWLSYYEDKMLPFVMTLGDIFGVIPIKDLQYQALPNSDKQSSLFVVQTRSNVTEVPGGVELYSIAVVAKYFLLLGVKCRINTEKRQIVPVDCVLWNNQDKQYSCITDSSGYIKNTSGLLLMIEKWAVAEKIAAWIPQEGPKPVETIHLEQKG